MAEQLICNQPVAGSIPVTGSTVNFTISYGKIPERPNGSDCKSDVYDFGSSNLPLPTTQTAIPKGIAVCVAGRGHELPIAVLTRSRLSANDRYSVASLLTREHCGVVFREGKRVCPQCDDEGTPSGVSAKYTYKPPRRFVLLIFKRYQKVSPFALREEGANNRFWY